MTTWWHLDVKEILKTLSADIEKGLSSQEAKSRLSKFGPNQLEEKKGRSAFSIFADQFKNLIVLILVGASLISGFLQEWVDAIAIFAIIILNAILGFVQEYRAEQSLAALKKLSSPHSKVSRDGQHLTIPSAQLVPGDLIELESGDNVPADSRLVWLSSNFSVQEASLTGESVPVAKTSLVIEKKDVPLAERGNMIYAGTSVASGKARAIIVETGMQTELGKIAELIQQVEPEATPLQKKLEQFGKWIVVLCLVLVGIIFALGVLRGEKPLTMFLTAVSLAVAAIPEGLPAVVSIALALGVQRMIKRNALIRKLHSVETLGCAAVICSDKTGTLTKNEMTVTTIFVDHRFFEITGIGYEPKGEFFNENKAVNIDDFPSLKNTLTIGVLCNGAELRKDKNSYKVTGDPTEGSLLVAAAKAGLSKNNLEQQFPFVDEIPFDSDRKRMTILRRDKGQIRAFVKGAPDVLLNQCTTIEERNALRPLTQEDKQKILAANNHLANQALRVLAVAYRVFEQPADKYDAATIEENLTFVGMVAMIDPPREEVKKAIQECREAGITPVMITGDHKNTAVAIAKQLGFFTSDSLALTGEELDRLDEKDFLRQIDRVSVYARVSPEHKLRIVRALRSQEKIVAMTGDGVNDAPAVKEADIGVAMGITGTDVTKEVSDMVITDDNFASIVAAVEEGRGIYDNIKKFIHYLLSCNSGEILVMFISSLMGWPAPLLPIHILWINLVTDGFPALALGMDPVDPNIMRQPPRPANENVVTRKKVVLIVVQGFFMAVCSLAAFGFVIFVEKESLERARTAAFTVLVCSQLFHSLNCRSMTESLFKIGVFTNKKLIVAIGISFVLQLGVIYIPFLQGVFKVQPLLLQEWCVVIMISSFPLWAMELTKVWMRRQRFMRD